MFFKNLQIYRLPAAYALTADQLAAALAPQAFVAPTSCELIRSGWGEPRENGSLVHACAGQFLIKLVTEKKLLPSSVINAVAKDKADKLEEAQGFRPGRKAMKELKEQAADELLPRAFPIRSETWCWIDPVHGWLCVDASSATRADDVVKLLLKSVERMPLESLRVEHSPSAMMTAWLVSDEAPEGFTIDQDAKLQATGESRATVRYAKHTLAVDEMRRHIATGKQCTSLAMTWRDKISIVLTESLSIKSIKPLDVLREGTTARDDAERFDSDFTLMVGELNLLLCDLMAALGGEAGDLVSPARTPQIELKVLETPAPHAEGNGPDPLYGNAVQVVMTNQRASISLIQRRLAIGYSRAARLLEDMEKQGVVSHMHSNGTRDILQQVRHG